METLVTDIFKANYRHCEVKHVGGPGDLGIDVLFIDDNDTKRLIQVKRREHPKRAEGFSTLQSI
ncbi:restriction endonuclease, partial [Klebsiella aerogenes]|uniref:restriction endonuclease n=1 Tax=Klebsiella aerogenes TaxID=548 RepID=UPI00131F35F8